MEKLKRGQPDKPGSLLRHFQDLLREDVKERNLFPGIKSLYHSLDDLEKKTFFLDLMTKIEVSKDTLLPLLKSSSLDNPDDPDWPLWVSKLRGRLYSPRLNLFRKIAHSPGGLKFLLDFRRDLLMIHRHPGVNLKPLDFDIVLLFELWFQEGFLVLEEITLDSAYRQIELIKNSDLVHPMVSIEEMGQRLGKDRLTCTERLRPHSFHGQLAHSLIEGPNPWWIIIDLCVRDIGERRDAIEIVNEVVNLLLRKMVIRILSIRVGSGIRVGISVRVRI